MTLPHKAVRVFSLDSNLALFYNPAVISELFLLQLPSKVSVWILLIFVIAATGCSLIGEPELTITWETESELDIIGFNLLRSESEDGPFEKINPDLIPPANDPNVGGEHTYVDSDVVNGVTYFYILETIDRQGSSSKSDPIAITAQR